MSRPASLKKGSCQEGFTLIELLVSVVLISMMIALASVALRQLVISWDSVGDPYPSKILPIARVRAMVHSLLPYTVQYSDGFGSRKDRFGFFFSGTREMVTFVSSQGLSLNQPVLVRLWLEKDRLVLSETPLYDSKTDYLEPAETDLTSRWVIMNELDSIHLSYVDEEGEQQELHHLLPQLIRLEVVGMNKRRQAYVFRIFSSFPKKMIIEKSVNLDI